MKNRMRPSSQCSSFMGFPLFAEVEKPDPSGPSSFLVLCRPDVSDVDHSIGLWVARGWAHTRSLPRCFYGGNPF